MFLAHGVMNVLGIVFPQSWSQLDCEMSFPKHFQVIKATFYSNKTQFVDAVETFVFEVLNTNDLDSQ